MAGNIPEAYRALEGFNTIYSSSEARLAIAISEVMKLLGAGEGSATIIGGDASAANQTTQITRLEEIRDRLPSSIGQQDSASSTSVVLASDYTLPVTTSPTVVIPADIPTLTMATAGTVYSISVTNVTCLEFFARNNSQDLRWHFLPSKVDTNNYFTLPVGISKSFPFTSEQWSGTLYFLSPTENNIEVEITAFAVSP